MRARPRHIVSAAYLPEPSLQLPVRDVGDLRLQGPDRRVVLLEWTIRISGNLLLDAAGLFFPQPFSLQACPLRLLEQSLSELKGPPVWITCLLLPGRADLAGTLSVGTLIR